MEAPFAVAEREGRQQHCTVDPVKFDYAIFDSFVACRVTHEWPVVWCDNRVPGGRPAAPEDLSRAQSLADLCLKKKKNGPCSWWRGY